MNKQQNKIIHGLLSELGIEDSKSDIVNNVTGGRTRSSSDMNYTEANLMIRSLQSHKERKVANTRKKIIHMMCMIGYVTPEGDADYGRIDSFIQNIGSRNPKKKKLYWLSPKEMNAVCTQVEAMYIKETKK